MNQHEFVAVYVAVPLIVAIGWLLWRTRAFLRNMVLYALAVGALVAVIRVGHLAWQAWEYGVHPREPEVYASCLAAEDKMRTHPRALCWT